jgi:hypothetical protein
MHLVVWVDGWQLQCCGPPAQVGHDVTWTLSDKPDREWLATTLGEPLADRITHAEDHHGGLPDDAPVARGVVRAISAAYCRYAPDPEPSDPRALSPVPGSAVLRAVARATGWEDEPPGLHFVGYVVDLRAGADPSLPT